MTCPLGRWLRIAVLVLLALGHAAVLSASVAEGGPGADADASVRPFNLGWRFHLGDVDGGEQPTFDDSTWRVVDLPHDWSIELPQDENAPDGPAVGYHVGGTGWYRKHFTVDAADAARSVDLIFDGIQQDSELWVNGHYLRLQPHGYIGFVETITPYLRPSGQSNVIAVRASNPGFNTRWYSGSGLYRSVKIRFREPVDVATWGLQLSTVWVHEGRAQVQVRATLRNDAAAAQTVDLALALHKPDGTVEDFALGQVRVAPASTEQVSELFTFSGARLWSPDSPSLYRADLRLRQDGRDVGGLRQVFGVRTIEVSATRGFVLNGQPVELKGGCLHHDNGLIGAAAFPTAEWRRVAIMKGNGFNAIRTSHNPPSSAFLDACDHLGMLVIDEFADSWELPKKPNGYTRYFAGHALQDLRAMVRRDVNHPSVVMWSIGNEIEERAQPLGLATARRLIACIREIDAQRPITNAICHFWDNPQWGDHAWDRTAPAFALLDVGGYNYKLDEYESDHARYPDRVMVGTESYPRQAYENWVAVEKFPYVIGDFVWTGMDHIGESGIGHTRYVPAEVTRDPSFLMPWPTWINWSGDIDITGNKKPQSYYRDVVWDRSVVELAVHAPVPRGQHEIVGPWGWPDEWPSWNWVGHEGEPFEVRVFSKAPRVRLELNGRVLGEKAIDAAHGIVAEFQVPFAPGELKAIALRADGSVAGMRTLTTTGPAKTLVVAPERLHVTASRDELIYAPIEVRDARGRVVNDAAVALAAKVSGPAELVALGSADPRALGSLRDGATETFHGRALLILRPTGRSGHVHLTVTAPSLAGGAADVDVE